MDEQEMNGVPLDRCPKCNGLWIDHVALDHVLTKSVPGRFQGHAYEFMSRIDAIDTDYRCPRCKLRTLLSRSCDNIELDWCDTCHGLFLDHSELESLVAWREAKVSEDRDELLREGSRGLAELLLLLLTGFFEGQDSV